MTKPRQNERVPLNCEVDFKRHGDARYRVELFDLSADGCCLSPPIRVEKGDLISLRIPEMEAIHGEIAWVQGFRAGVRFDHPFHAAVFDHVVGKLSRPSAS
jgi:hypothetical protein